VLFSEPKIPQLEITLTFLYNEASFQCSSASRKFLNPTKRRRSRARKTVSVLFSEPKIPQSPRLTIQPRSRQTFQCSSASRKFLNSI